MSSADARTIGRALVNVGVVGLVVWYSVPNRPPLSPYVWRTTARALARVADLAMWGCLWARRRYWLTVQS